MKPKPYERREILRILRTNHFRPTSIAFIVGLRRVLFLPSDEWVSDGATVFRARELDPRVLRAWRSVADPAPPRKLEDGLREIERLLGEVRPENAIVGAMPFFDSVNGQRALAVQSSDQRIGVFSAKRLRVAILASRPHRFYLAKPGRLKVSTLVLARETEVVGMVLGITLPTI